MEKTILVKGLERTIKQLHHELAEKEIVICGLREVTNEQKKLLNDRFTK